MVRDRRAVQGVPDRARRDVPDLHQHARRHPQRRRPPRRIGRDVRPRGGGGLARHVVLPGALPDFFTGLRFALAVSWLVLVFAEQINATSGLGYLVVSARDFLRTDIIVVALFVYGLLGFGADALVRLLERGALQWRSSFTGT